MIQAVLQLIYCELLNQLTKEFLSKTNSHHISKSFNKLRFNNFFLFFYLKI